MTDAEPFEPSGPSLGPAMRFLVALAARRDRGRTARGDVASRDTEADRARTTLLWDLAERYHPEEVWLAESYVRGERSLVEVVRLAPRGALTASFVAAVQAAVEAASALAVPGQRRWHELSARHAEPRRTAGA